MNFPVSAKLIAITQPMIGVPASDAEKLISYCARVSSGLPKEDRGKDAEGLLKYCIRNKHWSIFEMANAVVEVEAPRDISRQLLRHRSFSFQEFCVAGDTLITTLTKRGVSKKVKISDLYKRQHNGYWNRSDNLVRIFDEKTKTLTSAKIKEVFDTGEKETFKVTLEGGKNLTLTSEHKLLTLNGFKRLKNISVGDFVATNGVALYQDKDWLSSAKKISIDSGSGLFGIADMAGVSSYTIRKWLKKHSLQFTKSEVAEYTQPWNKGLPKEDQPCFGRIWSEAQRDHHRIVAKKGKESNLYVNGNSANRSWRKFVADECSRYRLELLHKQGFKCAITGESLTADSCEVDHIQPVYLRPDLALNKENLQVLSKVAHKNKSTSEIIHSRKTVKYKPVVSIVPCGVMQTYDMEIEHVDHNYVANGIVTHNSQRYSDDIEFVYRQIRSQDNKNRQNSIDNLSEDEQQEWDDDLAIVEQAVTQLYSKWREKDGAKECVRVVLPEGLTMSHLYVNGTIRSWLHYLEVREGNGTQLEHIALANEIHKALEPALPTIFGAFYNNG